jgi:uncharacterized protein YccT (UPF0319 family)
MKIQIIKIADNIEFVKYVTDNKIANIDWINHAFGFPEQTNYSDNQKHYYTSAISDDYNSKKIISNKYFAYDFDCDDTKCLKQTDIFDLFKNKSELVEADFYLKNITYDNVNSKTTLSIGINELEYITYPEDYNGIQDVVFYININDSIYKITASSLNSDITVLKGTTIDVDLPDYFPIIDNINIEDVPCFAVRTDNGTTYYKQHINFLTCADENTDGTLKYTLPTITQNTLLNNVTIDTYISETNSDDEITDDESLPYVTFKAQKDNSSIGLEKLSTNQTMEYSTDTTSWNTFDTETNISLNSGDKVYVRGILSADNTQSNYTQFNMTGKIAASGNCNAIWNYQDLNAPLKAYCGYYMFERCISLVQAPKLPATELADYCYSNMFNNCSTLTTVPELPATELTPYCYRLMFAGCYVITTVQKLPATTLAEGCYNAMFFGCRSLTTAPELPATILAKYCYWDMFDRCSSLVTAPDLPATVLVYGCYSQMFLECKSLNYIKCLSTDLSSTDYTGAWVKNVSSTGTFVKHPNLNNWSTGTSGIPSGWDVQDAVL